MLDLKLFDAGELSGALEVLNDGSVPLPLVGVRLSGLTLQQATLCAAANGRVVAAGFATTRGKAASDPGCHCGAGRTTWHLFPHHE